MNKFTIIIFTICVVACNNTNKMNEKEIELIEIGDETTAFRVLTINNADDLAILRTPCTDLNFAADSLLIKKLIARLYATLTMENGVGIAAPQIGISRNLFLFMRIDKPEHPVEVAINPKIVRKPDESICFEGDGCLSIPGEKGNTQRYAWIEVEYQNEHGQVCKARLNGLSRNEDFTGVIFQHEYDHLQGILYTDRLIVEE